MKIVFSFDDGSKEDIKVAELLCKYGFKDAIFYIPSEWQSYNLSENREPLTLWDVKNLAHLFEIGSHSVSHRLLTRIPEEEVKREVTDSFLTIRELFNRNLKSFCYPRGYANDSIREEVRKYYKHARNTLVGNIKESEDPIWDTPAVHICGKRRKEYENTTWLKEARRLLKEAINTPESVYHLWGHSWEISRYDGWHDFEELLKELGQYENSHS